MIGALEGKGVECIISIIFSKEGLKEEAGEREESRMSEERDGGG